MSFFAGFVRRVARAETPAFRFVKKAAKAILYPTPPRLPRFLLPPFRAMYAVHYGVINLWRSFFTVVYYTPLFQSRCASFGRQVSVDGMVFVHGPVEIHVSDRVRFAAKVCILSGHIFEKPQLVMKEHSVLGFGTMVTANKEVVIEEDVIVSYNCNISDTDGHPREADLRAQGLPPYPEDIHPVRICKYAWIGNGAYIMKGVTVGEGAVVAANSVVMSNVPPYSLVVGNPAEVLFRNYGRPSTERRKRRTAQPQPPPQTVEVQTPGEPG